MFNQVGSIRRGQVWSSLPTTALGMHKQFADKDYSVDPATHLTNMDVECIVCKNTSGGTLTRATVVKFDTSTPAMFTKVSATAGAGERGDGVVDEYVSSTTGVPANYYFLLVRKGPCKLTSSTSTAIAVKDPLITAASGKVIESAAAGSAANVGYALEAVSASATLFRAYVNFDGPLTNEASPKFAGATFSVGTEASNVITVAVQLTDASGADINYKCMARAYLSSDTAGDAVASDPGSWAAGTDGTLVSEELDDLVGTWRSEADGDIDVAVTSAGTSTFYLNVMLPDGRTVQSGAITFA